MCVCVCVVHPSVPQKSCLRITKDYISITLTAIAAKVYNVMLLNRIRPKENSLEKSEQFSEKSIQIFSNSIFHRRSSNRKSQDHTDFYRFLQGIWFHTQRKDGANTSSIWSPQINCQFYKDVLQKHESKWFTHLTMTLISLTLSCKKCISTISIYNLTRLCSTNVNRSNGRKWSHSNKNKTEPFPH